MLTNFSAQKFSVTFAYASDLFYSRIAQLDKKRFYC